MWWILAFVFCFLCWCFPSLLSACGPDVFMCAGPAVNHLLKGSACSVLASSPVATALPSVKQHEATHSSLPLGKVAAAPTRDEQHICQQRAFLPSISLPAGRPPFSSHRSSSPRRPRAGLDREARTVPLLKPASPRRFPRDSIIDVTVEAPLCSPSWSLEQPLCLRERNSLAAREGTPQVFSLTLRVASGEHTAGTRHAPSCRAPLTWFLDRLLSRHQLCRQPA